MHLPEIAASSNTTAELQQSTASRSSREASNIQASTKTNNYERFGLPFMYGFLSLFKHRHRIAVYQHLVVQTWLRLEYYLPSFPGPQYVQDPLGFFTYLVTSGPNKHALFVIYKFL